MSPSLLITPSVSAPIVSVDAEAKALRDKLLAEANTVTTVTDRLEADSAIVVLRSLSTFLKDIEASREAVKAPVLKIAREIDAMAKDLVALIKIEETRISRACGAFEAEERRKAEDARRAAEAEAARIAFEAAKATRAAMASAPNQEAAHRAADEISGQAQTAIHEVKAAAVAIAPPKPAASTLRADVCFEVTDMAAFFAAQPTLVKLEPNGPAIRAILKANPNIVIPGLRHWTDEKLNLR
jgi:hypothetical protein